MRRLALVAAGLIVAGAFALGYGLSRGDRATEPVAITPVIDQVRDALAASYYRVVPPRVLRLPSVGAMISALGDPYTAYLPQADYALLRQETAGTYSGIGVGVVAARNGLLVVSTRPGPARAAGLRVGDRILRIDGVPSAGLTASEALARVAGPIGKPVHLELVRDGRAREVSVPRASLRAADVAARAVAYGGRVYGDVRIATFSLGVAAELRADVRRLEAQGASGLVLDLRGDPGGVLEQAVACASVFLDGGAVVSLRSAHEPEQTLRARRGRATTLPLVVLVDRATASSAEVLAAALRDHHRARIVGTRTYGKALVQSIDPLGDGGALELTVAHYYTPAGRDISGVGLRPDVHAVDRPRTDVDEALSAALDTLAREAGAGHGDAAAATTS